MTRVRNMWFVPDRAHLPGTVCRFRGYGQDFLVYIDGVASAEPDKEPITYICTPIVDDATGTHPGRDWLREGGYRYNSFPALENHLETVL